MQKLIVAIVGCSMLLLPFSTQAKTTNNSGGSRIKQEVAEIYQVISKFYELSNKGFEPQPPMESGQTNFWEVQGLKLLSLNKEEAIVKSNLIDRTYEVIANKAPNSQGKKWSFRYKKLGKDVNKNAKIILVKKDGKWSISSHLLE